MGSFVPNCALHFNLFFFFYLLLVLPVGCVKCASLQTQFLDCFDNSTLHFSILLSVNALLRTQNMFSIEVC